MRSTETAPRSLLLTAACFALLVGILCGCGPAKHRIQVDGKTRTYLLHVPPGSTSEAPLSLLLVLHPFTGTGRSMARTTGFNALAEEASMIMVYPDGLRRRWNATDAGEINDVKFLLELVDQVSRQYAIDPERVYVAGASAGGIMAQFLACRTNRFKGFASVMAALPRDLAQSCANAQPVPALLIHGAADPIIPYNGGVTPAGPGRTTDFLPVEENLAYWAGINGCSAEPVTADDAQEGPPGIVQLSYGCPNAAPATLLRVVGGGHTWPGGRNPYPRFIVGETSAALSASSVIVQFFNNLQAP